MKCPVCKSIVLEQKELQSGLTGYHCSACEGNWIRFADYDQWNRNNPASGTGPVNAEYRPEYDTKKPSLCPDCGLIVTKYKVSPKLSFSVDHCGSCNGIWLDKNEWENLISNKLHHHINEFFTAPWQVKLREEMTAYRFEEHYRNKFGAEDYEKLKGIREFVQKSKLRSEVIAFITDENPYKL